MFTTMLWWSAFPGIRYENYYQVILTMTDVFVLLYFMSEIGFREGEQGNPK